MKFVLNKISYYHFYAVTRASPASPTVFTPLHTALFELSVARRLLGWQSSLPCLFLRLTFLFHSLVLFLFIKKVGNIIFMQIPLLHFTFHNIFFIVFISLLPRGLLFLFLLLLDVLWRGKRRGNAKERGKK